MTMPDEKKTAKTSKASAALTILRAEKITHRYSPGTPFEKVALDDVSLSIEAGDFVGVIGQTGSGKSTLVQLLNGLIRPTEGRIFVEERNIWAQPKKIRAVRFKVGLCFQYPEHQLFEETVYKDIAFGPRNMGLPEEEIDQRVNESARFVGLRPSLLQKSPFDLSGGERRRAAIAGVLAMEPTVLILDEPTAGLDPKGRDAILEQIRAYREQKGSTVILVSHSMEDIARVCNRVLVMHEGRLALSGTVDEVYSEADRLRGMGLDIPDVTRIFRGLAARGFAVSPHIYTARQGRDEILRLLGEKGVRP